MVKIFRTTVGSHITINGKKYANVDEMPPDIRKQYEQAMQSMMADKDHNGVPDILEHPSSSASFGMNKMQSISVNGKHYDRLEDVPPEFRDAIAKALARQQASTTNTQLRLPAIQSDGSSITKWIILIAALFTAGAIGWLLHK